MRIAHYNIDQEARNKEERDVREFMTKARGLKIRVYWCLLYGNQETENGWDLDNMERGKRIGQSKIVFVNYLITRIDNMRP